jgi:prepilin signal peptidase PulO-like enzyme (type II secretory pathway)
MSVIFTASIPDWFITQSYGWAFILGAIIGSFLNVYIYRFHTGKSLAGHSHCLSCGEELKWYELWPIVSYLAILGRCRYCHSKVPIRYLVVELLTAVLFTLTLTLTNQIFLLCLLWLIAALLVVILTYDFYHFIIPDGLTLALTSVLVLLAIYRWLVEGVPAVDIGFDALSALLGSGFFLLLWLISKGEWLGFGDVKLVFPLGWLVGANSVFSFIVVSFWIGAIVSLLILGVQYVRRGKSHLHLVSPSLTMKSAVPFAPFLIAGALVTFYTQFNVLSFFVFIL